METKPTLKWCPVCKENTLQVRHAVRKEIWVCGHIQRVILKSSIYIVN